MAQREASGGRLIVIDDVCVCVVVACDALLEAFFQRLDDWFDLLSN